jgi:cephalosporin hydroxylase
VTPREIAHLAYENHHASQREEELAEMLGVVAALDPKVIVEVGCDAGGTLFCWRQLCDAVYGITLPDNTWPTGGQSLPRVDHGALVHVGDSHDPASKAWLDRQLGSRQVDVLFIDGDHSYAGVKTDYEMYSPLVRPGGLVLIHDVLNGADPRVEVPRFWRELDRGSVIARPMRPIGFGVVQMEGTAA